MTKFYLSRKLIEKIEKKVFNNIHWRIDVVVGRWNILSKQTFGTKYLQKVESIENRTHNGEWGK